MNLTVAWAPSGGWDSKTEQPGGFAQAAELSRRTDSHVNLPRLPASRSLKDFQECLRQLGEGRAADAGEQPQWRAYQRPSEPSPGGTGQEGALPSSLGTGAARAASAHRALCPGGGGHGSEPKAAPPREALGPCLSQALSSLTTPPTLALQGSGRTKAGEGPGATTEGSPGPRGGTTSHMPACQTLPASANGRHQIPVKTTALPVQEAPSAEAAARVILSHHTSLLFHVTLV